MAVDLGNFTDNFKREMNPPGVDLFAAASDDEMVGRLSDAFWKARIEGIHALDAYTCDENGLVTPYTSVTPDIGRDLVQLVILYAAQLGIRNRLANLRTQFRAAAGPAQFEYQQSAQVLRDVLADLKEQKAIILQRLSDLGSVPPVIIDGILARDESYMAGLTFWIGQSVDPHARGAFSGQGMGP